MQEPRGASKARWVERESGERVAFSARDCTTRTANGSREQVQADGGSAAPRVPLPNVLPVGRVLDGRWDPPPETQG